MRICFYNVTASFLTGGLETYCWEAGKALTQQGHEVTIMAGNQGQSRDEAITFKQYAFKREQQWPNWGSRFRRLMERLSFARHAMPDLIAGQYDAVIVNKPFDFPALWYAKRQGLKSCCIFRSGGREFYPLDRQFMSAVDYWVSTSRYNAEQVQGRYHQAVQVIHNGVDTENFSPQVDSAGLRVQLGVESEAQLIVSIGRLVGWKGHHIIIQALPNLPETTHYVLMGEGDAQSELEQLAERLGVSQRVHFLGKIKHADLPAKLVDCDVFVQPSVGEEAFGISVVEAMAVGLPVLAANNGGMKEIIWPSITGELIETGNQAAWTEALQRLLKDHVLQQHYATQGRQRAVEVFTWAANAAKLEQLIQAKMGRCAE